MVTINAYAYEADYHCVSCAVERFGVDAESLTIMEATDLKLDQHAIPYESYDREGNQISVVFAHDEDPDGITCGGCGHEIQEPWDGIMTAITYHIRTRDDDATRCGEDITEFDLRAHRRALIYDIPGVGTAVPCTYCLGNRSYDGDPAMIADVQAFQARQFFALIT